MSRTPLSILYVRPVLVSIATIISNTQNGGSRKPTFNVIGAVSAKLNFIKAIILSLPILMPAHVSGQAIPHPEWNGGPVRQPGTAIVFIIDKGQKRSILTFGTFHHLYYGDPATSVPVSTHLDSIPSGPDVRPETMLIHGKADPTHYFLIDEGAKRPIKDINTFHRYGFREELAKLLPQSEVDKMKPGEEITVPINSVGLPPSSQLDWNGGPVRQPGTAVVFIIDKGQKRQFRDKPTFNKFYSGDATQVRTSDYLDSIETGPLIDVEAKLVSGSDDPQRYFLLESGVKRLIGSIPTFDRYRFQKELVKVMPQNELNLINSGEAITVGPNSVGLPPSPHPELNGGPMRLPNDAHIYIIDRGMKRMFPDRHTINNLYIGNPGNDVRMIKESSELDNLPEGLLIPEGSMLVSTTEDPDHIYLLEPGNPEPTMRVIGSNDTFSRYSFDKQLVKIKSLPFINSIYQGKPMVVISNTETPGGLIPIPLGSAKPPTEKEFYWCVMVYSPDPSNPTGPTILKWMQTVVTKTPARPEAQAKNLQLMHRGYRYQIIPGKCSR